MVKQLSRRRPIVTSVSDASTDDRAIIGAIGTGPSCGPAGASILDALRHSWFLIIFAGGAVYWVARQDGYMNGIQSDRARILSLELRASGLESGLAQLQLKIDGIKEDLNLIKSAVIR